MEHVHSSKVTDSVDKIILWIRLQIR